MSVEFEEIHFDPSHLLDVVKSSTNLESASEKLGATPGYLETILDRFGHLDVTVEAHDEFQLGTTIDLGDGDLARTALPPIHQNIQPWIHPIPKKQRSRWPGGAWSPSRFKRLAMCGRNHYLRYGPEKRPDPTRLDGIVGNACHGTFQDAGAIRMARRKGVPMIAGKEELIHLLEFQPEVIHDQGTEVLKRSRQIILDLETPLHFGNVWAVEFGWSFHVTAGFLVAGYADLIEVWVSKDDPNRIEFVRITDYKTGPNQVPTVEDLRSDPQACLQLIWGKRYFRDAKRVQFRIWNVSLNQEVFLDWDHEIEASTISFARAAQNLWQHQSKSTNVGEHCRYCPYRSDCSGYNEWINKQNYSQGGKLSDLPIEQKVSEFYRYRTLERLSEARRKDLAELLLAEFKPFQKNYKTGPYTALKKSREMEILNDGVGTVLALCELTGTNLLTLIASTAKIDVDKLRAWVRSLPEGKRETAIAMLDSRTRKRNGSPWVEVRRKKPLF